MGSVIEIFEEVEGSSVLLASYQGGNELSFKSYISTTNACRVNYRTSTGPHWNHRGFKLGYRVNKASGMFINICLFHRHRNESMLRDID